MQLKEFQQEIKADKTSFIFFTADFCGPCKALKPVFKMLTDETKNCNFMIIDVEASEDIAMIYNISKIPTIKAFRKGKELNSICGPTKAELQEFISIYAFDSFD